MLKPLASNLNCMRSSLVDAKVGEEVVDTLAAGSRFIDVVLLSLAAGIVFEVAAKIAVATQLVLVVGPKVPMWHKQPRRVL